jgi:hypothetical protein
MPTDTDLEIGIRCTTSFLDSDGVEQVYEHSNLRYTHAKGGILEVPMDRFWNAALYGVSITSRAANFHIPFMEHQAGYFSEKQNINTFRFDQMLMSHQLASPEHLKIDRIEFDVAKLGNYIGHFPIERQQPSMGADVLKCISKVLHPVDLPGASAKAWIEGGYELTGLSGGGFDVRPRHRVIFDLHQSDTYDLLIPHVKYMSTFWEFMLHRPIHPGQVMYKSKHHRDFIRHMFKESTDEGTPKAWFQTGMLQMPWDACAPYLPQLLQRWSGLKHDSAWMDNLMRLIHFRDMPTDIRFFMAYTAVQGFALELGIVNTLSKRGGKEEDRLWGDFESFWNYVLFPMEAKARAYTDRLVRTRHHFAHLSKANEDILKADEEYSLAFYRLMVILKAMFMDASGVPKKDWQHVLSQWAVRIQVVEGEVFKNLVLGPM